MQQLKILLLAVSLAILCHIDTMAMVSQPEEKKLLMGKGVKLLSAENENGRDLIEQKRHALRPKIFICPTKKEIGIQKSHLLPGHIGAIFIIDGIKYDAIFFTSNNLSYAHAEVRVDGEGKTRSIICGPSAIRASVIGFDSPNVKIEDVTFDKTVAQNLGKDAFGWDVLELPLTTEFAISKR